MKLLGKNALVTGGNTGIGRAVVLALAEKGANVAFCYYKNKKKAEETIEMLKEYDVSSFMLQADVRDFSQVKEMVDIVKQQFGKLDILVNNAGISGPNHVIDDISIDEWKNILEVNLTGVFNCCKAAKADLVENNGKIVNISSIAGKMGGTIGCHYAASKAGVIGLTFALASELAPHVTVNAVAPGPVDTDLLSTDVKNKLSKQTPFGRIAKPEEVAHTVIYLLENDYVSGEVVDVNGGRYMD